jgi:PAS domain S-box-containing protein
MTATLKENCFLLKVIKKRHKKLSKLSSYLSQLESHLALIFATSPDIMMLLSNTGEIVKVNDAITNLFGVNKKYIEGKYLWQMSCFSTKQDLIKHKINKLVDLSASDTEINGLTTTCKAKNNTIISLKWKFVIVDKQKRYIVAIASQPTR